MLQNVNDLEWDNKDIKALLNRMVQAGEVVSVDGGKRHVSVKFPALGGLVCSLQMGTRRALGVNTVHSYSPGEQVWCLFNPTGDANSGVVLCATYNGQDTPWTDSADIDGVRYPDGSFFTYDQGSKAFTLSLLDGSVSVTMTSSGIVFKGKATFEDPAEFKQAVTCDSTLDAKGNISSEADIGAAGELSDKDGSMSGIRETYNDHDHEYDDGTTDKPNQKMQAPQTRCKRF